VAVQNTIGEISMDSNKLYLSITHYNDPKQTIFRKVHTSRYGASVPISLRCKVKEYKYITYKPVLVEVFELDMQNNVIIPISKDDMTQPTEMQIDTIKGMCEALNKVYNEPETSVVASAWIVDNMEKYNKKCDDALDKNKTSPTEKQLSYIKGICEVLEIEYKEPKTKGEATVWLNHFVPFYKRKCEEDELEWDANHSDLMDNYGDWSD
jgi:hypothetical protein